MRVNYRTHSSTQFRLLSEDQAATLYRSALHVLEHTGMLVHEEETLGVLRGLGARVEGERAYIPSVLVNKARITAPASFTVYSRSGNDSRNIDVSANYTHYGPGPTPPNFRDPQNGERRKYVRSDAAAVARVCDALDGISFVQSLGTISDVHPDLADLYEFAEMIAHTDKPIVSWSYNLDTCRDIHQIALAVAGDEEHFLKRPNYVFYAEPLSPLTSTREAAQKLVYCARHRIPLIYTPCPMAGGTAPATFAGVLVTAISESLLGLVVSQGLHPGTPFIMGGVVSVMDMKTTVLSYGAPELSLLSAGLAEAARFLDLPVWSTGGCTDSKLVDEQAGIEGALSVLFAGLSGANLVHDVGYIESGLTGSLQQLVLMNETISFVRRILRGIGVSDRTLALDVIDQVGPGGQFLDAEHTYRQFRSEFWFPALMDRQRWSEWVATGRKGMGDRVQARLTEILNSHQAVPLESNVQKRIETVLAAAEGRMASVGVRQPS